MPGSDTAGGGGMLSEDSLDGIEFSARQLPVGAWYRRELVKLTGEVRRLLDERDVLGKRVEELEAGITRYAKAVDAPCAKTTVDEADEAYKALLRLVAFRPRIRATSEVER